MAYERIRCNAFKKIESILATAVLVKEFYQDDWDRTGRGKITAADVMKAGRESGFQSVYQDGEILNLMVHMNWTFTAYQSIEAARKNLTPIAFAKYFPELAEAMV
jgi:hypothetical protein